MTTHPTKLALSVQEAADMMSLSHRHMYGLVRSGQIQSFKSGGRRLVRLSSLHDYVDRQCLKSA